MTLTIGRDARRSGGQDEGSPVGDRHGVLDVRGESPVRGRDRPAVIALADGAGPRRDDGLDRDHQPGGQRSGVTGNVVVEDQRVGTGQLLGITYPVYFMFLVALVVWYVLERTPAGRRVYATGGNIDAARLAGVGTATTIILSLIACGVIASAAGALVSSRLATGDPTVGPSYLLPAFAAAFLGSTQFRGGHYNVWGTVFAVYLLGMGVKGLQLAGAPLWIPELFNDVALLLAVGIAKRQGAIGRTGALSRFLSRARPVKEGE